jgi:hypothetical protein
MGGSCESKEIQRGKIPRAHSSLSRQVLARRGLQHGFCQAAWATPGRNSSSDALSWESLDLIGHS